jgi:hypothetical protein
LVQSKTPNELPIESSFIEVLKMRSINSTTNRYPYFEVEVLKMRTIKSTTVVTTTLK